MDRQNVPPPEDEQEIAYIYNPRTQTVHKWPGCSAIDRVHPYTLGRRRFDYWTSSQLAMHRLEHGVIHNCRLCWPPR